MGGQLSDPSKHPHNRTKKRVQTMCFGVEKRWRIGSSTAESRKSLTFYSRIFWLFRPVDWHLFDSMIVLGLLRVFSISRKSLSWENMAFRKSCQEMIFKMRSFRILSMPRNIVMKRDSTVFKSMLLWGICFRNSSLQTPTKEPMNMEGRLRIGRG